jgi:hypothetical protein
MTFPNQISNPAASNAPTVVNEEFATLAHQACYGKKARDTTGLTWGVYGGRWGGFSVADTTLTLTASSTNYVVVAVATGVISVSTSATNWNDADNYVRVYKIPTGASGPTTASIEDHRFGPGGVAGGGGGGSVTSGDISDFTEASQDVVGAMIAAAGGSYNDGAGTITLPSGYAPGGTDVAVADGGTGASSLTAYAVLCGGTTSTGAVQPIASVGTAGHVLTSNGAGALPTFQAVSGGVSDGDKGDITVSSSGATWTVDSGVITSAKLANMAQNTLKGRYSSGTGVPEDLTYNQIRLLINKKQALSDASTVAWDADLGVNARVTLGGNRTLGNPTNLADGDVLNLRIIQDATGSRTLSYSSKYKFAGGTAPVLTTAANAIDFLSCQYDATADTLFCVLSKDHK